MQVQINFWIDVLDLGACCSQVAFDGILHMEEELHGRVTTLCLLVVWLPSRCMQTAASSHTFCYFYLTPNTTTQSLLKWPLVLILWHNLQCSTMQSGRRESERPYLNTAGDTGFQSGAGQEIWSPCLSILMRFGGPGLLHLPVVLARFRLAPCFRSKRTILVFTRGHSSWSRDHIQEKIQHTRHKGEI